jgi:hypothetical protein
MPSDQPPAISATSDTAAHTTDATTSTAIASAGPGRASQITPCESYASLLEPAALLQRKTKALRPASVPRHTSDTDDGVDFV